MKPPCQWIVEHIGEMPVRCGEEYFAHLAPDLPVCVDHWQFSRLHAGVW